MKKLLLLYLLLLTFGLNAQTLLTEANNFHVKTIEGDPIYLFPILDDDEQIVVIDFFSTSCGPCQDFAPDFQQSYVDFGENQGNVYFMGINWGNDNQGVHEFDSIFGLTYPTASGTQGGGNIVFLDYQIQSYPTVIVIKPDHQISNQYVWEPSNENINAAVIEAGGLMVGKEEIKYSTFKVYPNPAKDFIYIQSENIDNETYLDIINLNGEIVYQEVLQKNNNRINLNLSAGLYNLRLINKQGISETSKLVITR